MGHSFDDSDWAAFEVGLVGTDRERGPWFDYPLARSRLLVAYEPGADEMVTVRLDGEQVASEKVRWLADLMREYRIVRRHP
jgi:hypothetical protein